MERLYFSSNRIKQGLIMTFQEFWEGHFEDKCDYEGDLELILGE